MKALTVYPDNYEVRTKIDGVGILLIRPINAKDAPLMIGLFNALSSRSIYLRFFSALRELPDRMLKRLTEIDYDREITLAAICEDDSGKKMLGAARIIKTENPKQAEFAVMVGDPWQGKGIGAELLKRCLLIAKEHGIEKVWGLVLAENTQMLVLGRKLNFKIKRVQDSSEFELTIDLKKDLDF